MPKKTKTWIDKICPVCKGNFKVELARRKQVSCSRDCSADERSTKMSRGNNKERKKWTFTPVKIPKQTFIKSKRFNLDVAVNILGYEFLGNDKRPDVIAKRIKYDLED